MLLFPRWALNATLLALFTGCNSPALSDKFSLSLKRCAYGFSCSCFFFLIFCNKVGENEDTDADDTERKEGELGEGDEEGDGERGEDRDVRIYYKIPYFFTFPVYTEKSCPL